MNVLALWALHAESKVIIIAFLWYPLSIICFLDRLCCLLYRALLNHLIVTLVLLNLMLFRVFLLAMMHGLIHKVELHLMVVIVVALIIAIIVTRVEILMRPLSHYLLCKVDLMYLLINQLLHLELLLSQWRKLLLLLQLSSLAIVRWLVCLLGL